MYNLIVNTAAALKTLLKIMGVAILALMVLLAAMGIGLAIYQAHQDSTSQSAPLNPADAQDG